MRWRANPASRGGSKSSGVQAEQEMLQRSSFEAARRNSMSSNSNSDHSGGVPYNFEAIMGGSGAQQGLIPAPYLNPDWRLRRAAGA